MWGIFQVTFQRLETEFSLPFNLSLIFILQCGNLPPERCTGSYHSFSHLKNYFGNSTCLMVMFNCLIHPFLPLHFKGDIIGTDKLFHINHPLHSFNSPWHWPCFGFTFISTVHTNSLKNTGHTVSYLIKLAHFHTVRWVLIPSSLFLLFSFWHTFWCRCMFMSLWDNL